MSDDRHQTSGCLDAETLAAFMDGRLEPRERAAVEAHLADCEDCYEVWMEGRGLEIPLDTRRSVWRPLPMVAVASGLVLAAWVGMQWLPQPASPVAAMVNLNTGARMTDAWLTDQVAWAPRPSELRATADTPPSDRHLAALALVEKYENDPTAEGARVLGLAFAAVGNLSSAEAALRRASALRPDWAEAHADLAAVLLEWCRRDECRLKASDALRHADESLRLRPNLDAAAFNRSVALERLGRYEDATQAWTEFLTRPVSETWKDEATARLRALTKR